MPRPGRLAAPGGRLEELAVIDISAKESLSRSWYLLTLLLFKGGRDRVRRGLSEYPDYTAKVTRAENLLIRATDRTGRI